MVLPQTNHQLFHLIREIGFAESDLKIMHTGYGVAQSLFGACYRPCNKPFICHLVGTAGALAAWNQSVETINAGLLHSAYLFGDFADGEKGATARRRNWLKIAVGRETEELVYRYTKTSWLDGSVEQLYQRAADEPGFRQILLIKIADVYEELVDGSISVTPKKRFAFGLMRDETEERRLLSAVDDLISAEAANQFSELIAKIRSAVALPPDFVCSRTSFYKVKPGIDDLRRGPLQRRLAKLVAKIGNKLSKAA